MPQVDLESLVSAYAGGSSDRKVACETTFAADDESDWQPPQSIWLSGDAEFDWFDRNAVVYERKESTKGSSSVFATSNPGSNNNSQRFSKNLMKSKATIIGLPKSQKSAFADASKSRRSHHNNARLFPKRSASVGKSGSVAVYEPSSPKVSCIGRVRSNRNRRFRTRQRSISSSTAAAATAASATSTAAIARQKSSRNGRRKIGFFESVRNIFRSGRRGKSVQKPDPSSEDSSKKKKNKRSNSRKPRGNSDNKASQNDESFNESGPIEPPGLGSLNRFASGRRSESWRVVADSEIHVAQ